MAIVVAGLSHRTVPLEVLERLAFAPEDHPKALAGLIDHEPIHEGVLLSTCNRTEVYANVHRFHPAVSALRRFLADASGVGQEQIDAGWYVHYEESAVRHLFSVASGLDSMVIGESQILGQVRDAYQVAHREGAARRMMASLFQRALRVGKRARSRTAISRHVVSLPQAAARLAAEASGGLEGRKAVVVGAGRMGELAARALRDLGCRDLVVVSRNPVRADETARALGVRAAALDGLAPLLHEADVLVAATSATAPVIDRELLAAATATRAVPLVAVDFGMPRDIDPGARDLPTVALHDIDDLRALAEEGAQQRRAELPKVREIVDEEVAAFCAWERALALGPSINELRTRAEAMGREEAAKIARRLDLDEQGRAALEALAQGIVNKLLHRPVTQIKELVRDADGRMYLETFRELFDLDGSED